jgi:hypothetical protein
MVSAVHHPVTLHQAENISTQPLVQSSANRAQVKAMQAPPAKPQPVQDSVKLSGGGDADRDGDSK